MSDSAGPGRRSFSRVSVKVRLAVHPEGHQEVVGECSNLSLQGVLVTGAGPLPAGKPCTIRLALDGTAIAIEAHGVIARATADGGAVRFIEIVGVDSLEHLRNLVLYNSRNPDQVISEFDQHWGLEEK